MGRGCLRGYARRTVERLALTAAALVAAVALLAVAGPGVAAAHGEDPSIETSLDGVVPKLPDRDRQAPGRALPPSTGKWTPLAFAHNQRTYHNTASLLPDGRVLVGGHAPISTLYTRNITLPGGLTAPNNGRDPSFEIYSPPYLFWGPRPVMEHAPTRVDYGKTFDVTTNTAAKDIKSVVLVRNTSTTHLVDAQQRNVVLPVVARHGDTLTVKAPPKAAVAPPGPYLTFVNRRSAKGLIPSKGAQTFVGISGLEAQAHHK